MGKKTYLARICRTRPGSSTVISKCTSPRLLSLHAARCTSLPDAEHGKISTVPQVCNRCLLHHMCWLVCCFRLSHPRTAGSMSRWRARASSRNSRLPREMILDYPYLLLVRLAFVGFFPTSLPGEAVDLESCLAVESLLRAPWSMRLDKRSCWPVEGWRERHASRTTHWWLCVCIQIPAEQIVLCLTFQPPRYPQRHLSIQHLR